MLLVVSCCIPFHSHLPATHNGRLETQNDGGRGRAGADARWAYVIELDDGNKHTGNPFSSGVGKCPN